MEQKWGNGELQLLYLLGQRKSMVGVTEHISFIYRPFAPILL